MDIMGYEMTLDSGFIGIIVLIAIVVCGALAIRMTLDSQFPKVRIDVRDRGMRQSKNFRILHTAIFKDDLIAMLMGHFVYMGDLSKLTYYTLPNGKRIYDAYLRFDYLFGFSDVQKSCLDERPIINLSWPLGFKDMAAKLDLNKGLLCPMILQPVNHKITELEVQNGKSIGTNYIQVMRRAQDVIEKNNPVMAVLISSIPLFLMGGIFCIMIYVSYMALGDSAAKIWDAAMMCRG